MKLILRTPRGGLSAKPRHDSPIDRLAAVTTDGTGVPGRAGRWHLGRFIPPEPVAATVFHFAAEDDSRVSLTAPEMALLVGVWNARAADAAELKASHDAADVRDRHVDAQSRALAGLRRVMPAAEPAAD